MKKSLKITAILDQPTLLVNIVEKLAYRRMEMGLSNALVPKGLKAIDISSTEAYVSGTIAIKNKTEKLRIPFITCFLFTCIKGKQNPYQLEWASSLS